jgi:adenylate kinase
MNIFVAGIHGVGKTFIASQAAPLLDMMHTSASKLIKEERASASWGTDKLVSDVDANQVALASAVLRHNQNGHRLLLDGHFVLKDKNSNFILLESPVFESLKFTGVVVIEEDVAVVLDRLKVRDNQNYLYDDVLRFMELEGNHAQKICETLNIPLIILRSPTRDKFISAAFSLKI